MQTITKKRIKRVLCTCMTISLIGTGIGSTFFGNADKVYAKETLQSIETIVKEAMATDESGAYTNPFTILEVVPDMAASTVTVSGIDETGAERVINNLEIAQNAGTAGYYVKGQEPVTGDLIKYLGDMEVTDDSGVRSWQKTELTDSVSRADLAEQLLLPVKGNSALVASNADDKSKPLYVSGDYKELREGEIIVDVDDLDQDGDKEETLEVTAELLNKLYAEYSYHYINHDYSGKDFDANASGEDAYVDVARGVMAHVDNITEETGNYTLSYEPVLCEDESTGNEVLHTEGADADKAYRFVAGKAEENGKVYFQRAGLDGEFDPLFQYDGLANATHRATFAYVKGATSGYKIVGNPVPIEQDAIENVPVGAPLYTYDEDNEAYVFAGFVACDDSTGEYYLDDSKQDIVGLMFLEGQSAEVSSFSLLQNRILWRMPAYSPSMSPSASPSVSASTSPSTTPSASASASSGASASPTGASSATPTATPTGEHPVASATPTVIPSAVPTMTPEVMETPTATPQGAATETPTTEPTEEPTAEPTEEPTTEPTEEPEATAAVSATNIAKISLRTETILNRIFMAPSLEQFAGSRKVLYKEGMEEATQAPTLTPTQTPAPTATPTLEESEEEELPEEELSENEFPVEGYSLLRAVAPTTVPVVTENLYLLEFSYTEEGNGVEPLYQVSYYDIPQERNGTNDNGEPETLTGFAVGAQYVINTDNRGGIVTNQNGTGVIAKGTDANEIADRFIYDYTPGIGFYNWTGENWIASGAESKVCRIRGAGIYFQTGLENRDWFKQYVFDREESECANLPVIVNTLAANDVKVEDINKNRLLLLQAANVSMCLDGAESGPQSVLAVANDFDYATATDTEKGCDLSAAVCKEVIRKVVQESYPVVSDYRIAREYVIYNQNNGNDEPDAEETPNIYYLVKGLTLNDLSMYYGSVGAPDADWKLIDPEKCGKQKDANDFNHVNTSIYTRNSNEFLNADFRKKITDEQVIQAGYAEVLLDIQNENIYRKTSDLEGEIPEEISQATAIRYILGYANKRAYDTKGSLHILELAPCAVYTLKVKTERDSDDKVIKSTIYTVTGDDTGSRREETLIELKETDIYLTQMTTAEFNGRVEDINAHYDMIYIGTETGKYQYQDEKYVTGGNDIIKDKQSDLFDFVKAGYPIIVADDLTKRETAEDGKVTLTVNSDVVDDTSYLYEFLDEVKEKENVFRLNNVSAPLLSLYVNLSRPSLELTRELGDNITPWYSAISEVVPLQRQSDGSYLAQYEFKVENKGSGGSDETFDCQLLIDMNGDGKYSDVSEDVEDIYVTDTSGNEIGRDGDGRYQLRAGNTYRLSYVVSTRYHGVIPWRIRVTQNDDTNLRRADVTGYYSIKNPDGQREKINILQINADYVSNFNMEEATALDAATVFKTLLTDTSEVPYDVKISTISVGQLTAEGIKAKFGEEKSADGNNDNWLSVEEYLAFFRGFDMLVLGFADDYGFYNGTALEAVRAYAEEGRSLLISHNVTKPGSGDSLCNYLKNTVGMTEAVTYPDLLNDGNYDAVDYPMLQELDSDLYYAESISRINQGRITMYPYLLESEHLDIGQTHAQHWQLDFARDADEDKETDLVVWYALENRNGSGEGIYDASPNDARNNYYLYSMGNVVYSGIGHKVVCEGSANAAGVIEATDAEINEVKLFINTLIAAYEAGIHYPSVNIIESYNPSSRDITSVYVSYDDQLKAVSEAGITAGVLDLQQDIYFKAEPASMIYNNQTATHKFTAEFYVEMPTAEGAQPLSFNGSTIYGRKLVATEGGYDGKLYYLDEAGTEQVLSAGGDGSYNLSPNVVYKTRIPISVLGDFGGAIFDERGADSYANARNARRIFVVVKEQVTNTRTQTTTDADAIDMLSVVRVQVFDLD